MTAAVKSIWRWFVLRKFASWNHEQRMKAVFLVRGSKDTWALDLLLTAAQDRYARVRWAAAECLAEWKDPSAVRLLVSLLGDGYVYSRVAAREALRQIGPLAVQHLVTVLKAPAGAEERGTVLCHA
jgi:HEAT repeat protein